jgi:hypothetical protein
MRILKIIAISFGVTSLVLTNISASQAIPVEDLFKAVFGGKSEPQPNQPTQDSPSVQTNPSPQVEPSPQINPSTPSEPPIRVASELVSQDIILSANDAAAGNDQDYNVRKADGLLRRTINWQPSGSIKKIMWRCVDNCGDEKKFTYNIELKNGEIILVMRAVNKEKGLIRVQLTTLTE